MPANPSTRIAAAVDALPIEPHHRILEIGCGPGVAARLVVARLTTGHIVATDRSAAAVAQAVAGSRAEIASGRLSVRHIAGEDFVRAADEPLFDLVLALRVGALDGRHPALGERILTRLAAATTPAARLFVDGHELPIRPAAAIDP